MIKIEAIFHFSFEEDEFEQRGQALLDHLRKELEKAAVEEDFSEKRKIINIKFIEEEVEAF